MRENKRLVKEIQLSISTSLYTKNDSDENQELGLRRGKHLLSLKFTHVEADVSAANYLELRNWNGATLKGPISAVSTKKKTSIMSAPTTHRQLTIRLGNLDV